MSSNIYSHSSSGAHERSHSPLSLLVRPAPPTRTPAVGLILVCLAYWLLIAANLDWKGLFWSAPAGGALIADRSLLDTDVHSLTFDPSGRILAAADSRGSLLFYDVPSLMPIHVLGPVSGGISFVSFSPDGRLAAGVSVSHGVINLWDVRTARLVRKLKHPGFGPILAAAFSPDGRTIFAATAWGDIRFWNVSTGSQCRRIRSLELSDAAFSPDGSLLATIDARGAVCLWNLRTGSLDRVLTTSGSGSFVGFSRTGCVLVAASVAGDLTTWDTSTWRRLKCRLDTAGFTRIALSAGFPILATSISGAPLRLWDVRAGRSWEAARASGPPEDSDTSDTSDTTSLALSRDGNYLARGTVTGQVQLWRTRFAPPRIHPNPDR